MERLKLNFLNIEDLGIPTLCWELYYNQGQVSSGIAYRVCALRDFGNAKEMVRVQDNLVWIDAIKHAEELKRQYGTRAEILLATMPSLTIVSDTFFNGNVNDLKIVMDSEVAESTLKKMQEYLKVVIEAHRIEIDIGCNINCKWGIDTDALVLMDVLVTK